MLYYKKIDRACSCILRLQAGCKEAINALNIWSAHLITRIPVGVTHLVLGLYPVELCLNMFRRTGFIFFTAFNACLPIQLPRG